MSAEIHVHKYELVEKKVLLHNEEDLLMADGMPGLTVGYDILKQWKCECGAITTSDLKRTII